MPDDKIHLWLYSDNTEPVRFGTSGRGNLGIMVSVQPDRTSVHSPKKLRKGGVNVSSMGTIGPVRMGRVMQMMSFAMAIYNKGVDSVDELLHEFESMGIEIHDHRKGKS